MIEFYLETLEHRTRTGLSFPEMTGLLEKYEAGRGSLVFLNSLMRTLLRQATTIVDSKGIRPSQVLAALCSDLLKSEAAQELEVQLAIWEAHNTREDHLATRPNMPLKMANVYNFQIGEKAKGISEARSVPLRISERYPDSIIEELLDSGGGLRMSSDLGYLSFPIESEGIVVGSFTIIYSIGSLHTVPLREWAILRAIFNPSNESAVSKLTSEVFDKKALRAFVGARRLASEGNSPLVEPRHLLFALFREDEGLFRLGLSLDDVLIKKLRTALRVEMPKVQFTISRSLPFSDSLNRVLGFARHKAMKQHDTHIRSQHLFDALLDERDAVVMKLLRNSRIR